MVSKGQMIAPGKAFSPYNRVVSFFPKLWKDKPKLTL